MINIPTIKCNGFVLRQLNKKDAASIAKYANNKKIAKNLTDRFPSPYTLADAKDFIKNNLLKKNTTHYAFGIDIDGEIVGVVSLGQGKASNSHRASFGYWLGEPFWGKGMMTEAVGKITDFGFKKLKLKRIEAQVYPYNPASASVLEKNGFQKEGLLRNSEKHWGKVLDTYIFAIIR